MLTSFEHYLRTSIELPDAEWNFIVPLLRCQNLAKQEVWQRAGQVSDQLAFVETGVLRSFTEADDRQIINAFFPADTMAGAFTSFLLQVPSNWTLQALTPCRLVSISHELLQELYDRHPCWLRWGLQVIEAQCIHKCRRELSFLRQSAAERYATMRQQYPGLEQQVAQYHLASYLGITPETLSRLRLATEPSFLDVHQAKLGWE